MHKLYTGGTFDLFHAGHVNFLRQCKKLTCGGKVIVSLNTDEFIYKYKNIYPINSYNDRQEILRSCKYVDDVIENIGGKDSKPSILQVNPDIIAIGTDWAVKDYYTQMGFTQEWLDNHDITLVYIPYTQNVSSTLIKKKITG